MTARQNSIAEEASNNIFLSDFDGKIYIAFRGAPMIPIEDTWTPKEILKKLKDTRTNYMEYRNKQFGKAAGAAMF